MSLGADLAADTSWIVTLTEAEIADLDRALTAARATHCHLGLPHTNGAGAWGSVLHCSGSWP